MQQVNAEVRALAFEAQTPDTGEAQSQAQGAGEKPRENGLEPSNLEGQGRDFELVDSQLIYQAAAARLKSVIEQNAVDITCGPLPQVMGDGLQLIDLFECLLGNAIRFRSARRARIQISTRQSGEEWLVAVRDNGIGMEAETLDRLFGQCRRPQLPAGDAGTHIGLAHCERIVQRHGGRLWAESNPGEGSVFYFTLPMVKPESLPAVPFRLGPESSAGVKEQFGL